MTSNRHEHSVTCWNAFHDEPRAAQPDGELREPNRRTLESRSKEELLELLKAGYEDSEFFRQKWNESKEREALAIAAAQKYGPGTQEEIERLR